MAELADATDSKSVVRKGVWVQVPLRALNDAAVSVQRSMAPLMFAPACSEPPGATDLGAPLGEVPQVFYACVLVRVI